MTQPCFAQKLCRSRISDWKLMSPRPRAIGSAATRRCWRRHRRRKPRMARDLRRGSPDGRAGARRRGNSRSRTVEPAIADPHRGDDQDQHNKLRKCKHTPRFTGSPEVGSSNALGSRNLHSPNLAHRSRVSIQSVNLRNQRDGFAADKGQAAQKRPAAPFGGNRAQPDLIAVPRAHHRTQLADPVDQASRPSPCVRLRHRR